MYFVKNNPKKLRSQIRKAIDFVLEENNEEMIKCALIGLQNLSPEELREKTISLLSSLNTYNDQQMLSLLKIVSNYYQEEESLPKSAYEFLSQQGCSNKNEQIRKEAMKILNSTSHDIENLPVDIQRQLDFENHLNNLSELQDPKEIETELKKL